ncbi:MAG: hypothetical protein HY462_01540 [Parcubacteria group bacterium]|nr:hypothetical protein [Parcubacteria group bacterium]
MPNVLVVGHDIGVAGPLSQVCAEIVKQNGGVTAFLRHTAGPTAKADNLIAAADLDAALCGMSSSAELAAFELAAAGWAYSLRKPVALFADLPSSVGRPFFEEFRAIAAMLFVPNEAAATYGRKLFPATEVVISGNPRLEEFFTPKLTRAEARAKLGIPNEAVMVLVPGGKDLHVNRLHFTGAIEAAAKLNRMAVVVIAIHPGDKNGRAIYEDLASDCVRLAEKKDISADDAVAGADIIVSSASTVGITGACQRKPVVNFFTEPALKRLESATGSRSWPGVDDGTELQVIEDTGELAQVMAELLDGRGRGVSLREAQERAYPQPEGGSAALIAKKVLELAAKK